MATRFTHTQTYDATPEAVFAMLSDQGFVESKATASGALTVEASVTSNPDGTTTIVSRRTFPSEVPSWAKSMTGDTITLTETQTWSALTGSGCTAEFSVDFGKMPITYSGTIVLSGSQTSTVVSDATLKASIPLMGGKVESLVKEQTVRYLDKEQSTGNAWLASHH